jgi:hypothetical protein
LIHTVDIRNFQSLRRVSLTLGRFTVITGESSTGKSALIRALRALACNISGTTAITRGADTAVITAHTRTATITLEHNRGAWRYRLLTPDGEQEFTKLNRCVPPAVTAALGLAPTPTGGTSLTFAQQFDKPYLCTETGSVVARELGELTNVDTIYTAVREANRRRAAAAATLKTRTSDRDTLITAARAFTGLPARLAACERAEAATDRAAILDLSITALRAGIDALDIATAVQERTVLPPVPDDTALLAAQHRLHRLRTLLRDAATATRARSSATHTAATATTTETTLHHQLHQLLVAAGTCPTCNRPMEA